MKKFLLPTSLFAGSMLMTLVVCCQEERGGHHSSNNTYAVTDSMRNGVKWNVLRTLDLRTGTYSNILTPLLNGNDLSLPPGAPGIVANNAVAAIAHDKENKKLYYTAMLTDKLYCIDLKTMRRTLVSNRFTGLMPKASDQSNIITRMVIADDNKGYALTNDGNHLIRFRTNSNNPSVTDLGSLIDAPGNNEMSVHNLCSSFGGDLVADDDDNLYLFTSRNHVFKINTRTRITRYMGTVLNLPANFTTSGVAVDKSEGKVVLVSAVDSSGLYSVNINTLAAKKIDAAHPYHPADLANSFVLETKRKHDHFDTKIQSNSKDGSISIYPNPVVSKEFKIDFNNFEAGTYTISVTDVNGKSITNKSVTLGGKVNTVVVDLPATITSGIYMVRVTDYLNNTWNTGKILVE